MGELLTVESSVKNLGFVIDSNLSMDKQINQVCGQGYGMLRKLWKISKKLTDKKLKVQLVHSGILSRLNYCNSLYASLPNFQVKKLQKLINSCARFICNIQGKRRFEHITPELQKLHFLPMHYRIKFKICLLVYNYFNGKLPTYLKKKLSVRSVSNGLKLRKDSDRLLLATKTPEKQAFRNRGISTLAPKVWNSLPASLRSLETVSGFRTGLKTYFYKQWLSES